MENEISELNARKFRIAAKLVEMKIWSETTAIAFLENKSSTVGTIESMEKAIENLESESETGQSN